MNRVKRPRAIRCSAVYAAISPVISVMPRGAVSMVRRWWMMRNIVSPGRVAPASDRYARRTAGCNSGRRGQLIAKI
jgi:hypothetical protein